MATLTYENILRSRIEQIMEMFTRNEVWSNVSISNEIGMHPSTTCRVMDTLIRAGLCVRVHRGTYALGFSVNGKHEFNFNIPGLTNEPKRVRAIAVNGNFEFFWVINADEVTEVQEFGVFSKAAGIITKNQTGVEALEEWKKKNPSNWQKIRSFLRERIF